MKLEKDFAHNEGKKVRVYLLEIIVQSPVFPLNVENYRQLSFHNLRHIYPS